MSAQRVECWKLLRMLDFKLEVQVSELRRKHSVFHVEVGLACIDFVHVQSTDSVRHCGANSLVEKHRHRRRVRRCMELLLSIDFIDLINQVFCRIVSAMSMRSRSAHASYYGTVVELHMRCTVLSSRASSVFAGRSATCLSRRYYRTRR